MVAESGRPGMAGTARILHGHLPTGRRDIIGPGKVRSLVEQTFTSLHQFKRLAIKAKRAPAERALDASTTSPAHRYEHARTCCPKSRRNRCTEGHQA